MDKAVNPTSAKRPAREERLAAQLRENLKRRKAQNREKASREIEARADDGGDDTQARPLPNGESTG